MGLLPNFQFRPTFIPKDNSLVVNQFGQTADALDKRFDEQLDFANKLSILASNVEVGEGDREFKDAAIKRVDDLVTRIQDEGIGFENASLLLSKEARNFAKDPKLTQSRRNFALQEEARKIENSLRAQGKLSFETDFEGFKSVTQDAEGKDVFNTFQGTGEATLDHFKDAKLHFGTLKADLETYDPRLGSIPGSVIRLLQQGTIEEITDADVRERVENVIDQFMESSTGGEQFKRINEAELREQFPNVTADQIETEVRNRAKDLLLAAGSDQTVRKDRRSFQQSQEDAIRLRASLTAQSTNLGFNVSSTANLIPNSKLQSEGLWKTGTDGKIRVGDNELKLTQDIINAAAVGSAYNATAGPGVGTILASVMKAYAHVREWWNDDELTREQLTSSEDGAKLLSILEADNVIGANSTPEDIQRETKKYLETYASQSVELEANAYSMTTMF